MYVKGLFNKLASNPEIKLCVTVKLSKQYKIKHSYIEALALTNNMKPKVACRLMSNNLVHEILVICKYNAGKLLRDINSICITDKSDFSDPSNSKHSEPYYNETAYMQTYFSTM